MRSGEQIESEIIAGVLGRRSGFPINVCQVADDIGVIDIRLTDCRDAFTSFQADGPVIYVNRTLPGARMRFIIAHELAHVMLRTPAALDLIEGRGQTRLLENEEGLANRIAGALLVPDGLVEAIKNANLTARSLERVAYRAGIPTSMLIARMAAAGVDIALLHWRRGKRTWHVVDRPGAPNFLEGRVRLSEIGRRAIERISRRESEIVIDCRIDDRHIGVNGRGYQRGGDGEHVLQFLAPKRDVWFFLR